MKLSSIAVIAFIMFFTAGFNVSSSIASENDTLSMQSEALNTSINKAVDYLVSIQNPEGFWEGLLDSDVSATADFILLARYLEKVDPIKEQKAVNYILSQQQDDGGWQGYPGGASFINISINAYFALKVAGVSAGMPEMIKAKTFILANGGADEADILNKYKMILFGQLPYSYLLPIDTILLIPGIRDFLFTMGYFTSVMVPVMIMYENHHICELPAENGIQEIFIRDPWKTGFDYPPIKAGMRDWAIDWLLERQEDDGNWAGVFTNSFWSLVGLHGLQRADLQPFIDKGFEGVLSYQHEYETTLFQQFSQSTLMDTPYVLVALLEAGMSSSDPVIEKAVNYILSKQSLIDADWKRMNPFGKPGGFAFERYNMHYPDVDTTFIVLDGLGRVDADTYPTLDDARQNAIGWATSMQNFNGGYPAWDKNCNPLFFWFTSLLRQAWAPYDGSVPEVAARGLLAMSLTDYDNKYRKRRAIRYIKRTQDAEGWWEGRWYVNSLYATAQIIQGLGAAGENTNQHYIQKAIKWLKSRQNADGGWGETHASYDHPELVGVGSSTRGQTAYVLIGLISAGEVDSAEVEKGIQYLLDNQLPDGSWYDEEFLGVNIVGYWYTKYSLLASWKSLHALALYRNKMQAQY